MMEARAALQSLTGQDVEGVPAVIASKEAAAEKAAYTVDSLESQKGDMTMYAPVSGTIGYRDAEAGEWASAGQKLLTIVDNSALYLDCAVAEQDIGVLQEGMDMDVSIDSLGETVKGRIIYISRTWMPLPIPTRSASFLTGMESTFAAACLAEAL